MSPRLVLIGAVQLFVVASWLSVLDLLAKHQKPNFLEPLINRAAGYSVLLDPEGSRKEPDPGSLQIRSSEFLSCSPRKVQAVQDPWMQIVWLL